MTISANSSFDPQVQAIVASALRLCQVLNAGLQPDAAQLAMGMTFLDIGMKALQSDGIFLRTAIRTTVQAASFIATGQITTPADTIEVEEVFYTDLVGNDVPISRINRRMYMELSDKETVGPPSQFYIEKAGGNVVIYLHPVGDASVVSVVYTQVCRFRDADSAGVTLDIEPKWQRTILYMLAADFALHYGRIDRADSLRATYEGERQRAMNDETERGESRFIVGESYSPYG